MKRLSKPQQQERDKIAGRVSEARGELEAYINEYNEVSEEAWEAVAGALQKVNDATREANEFRDAIYTEQQDYFDARTDRWQESEAGEAFSEWHEAWGEEFAEVELDRPDGLEMPEVEAMALEELPEEGGAG